MFPLFLCHFLAKERRFCIMADAILGLFVAYCIIKKLFD